MDRETLVLKHYQMAERIGWAMAKRFDCTKPAPEDVVQDALEILVRVSGTVSEAVRRGNFREEGHLSRYLYGCIYKGIIDGQRRMRSLSPSKFKDGQNWIKVPLDTPEVASHINRLKALDNTEEEALAPLKRRDLCRFLKSVLPTVEGKVLVGWFFENRSMKELSKMLNISECYVSQVKTRAINRLRAKHLNELLTY